MGRSFWKAFLTPRHWSPWWPIRAPSDVCQRCNNVLWSYQQWRRQRSKGQ